MKRIVHTVAYSEIGWWNYHFGIWGAMFLMGYVIVSIGMNGLIDETNTLPWQIATIAAPISVSNALNYAVIRRKRKSREQREMFLILCSMTAFIGVLAIIAH